MCSVLVFGCGDVKSTGDDDDDDSADAAAGAPDGSGGGDPDARPGDPDASPGVPDAKPGDPDARPEFCGGFGGITCSETQWCDFDLSCGFDDGGGVCRRRPDACPDVKAPVCGCDFHTYGNACEAHAAGWDVLHDGPCDETGGGGGGMTPGG